MEKALFAHASDLLLVCDIAWLHSHQTIVDWDASFVDSMVSGISSTRSLRFLSGIMANLLLPEIGKTFIAQSVWLRYFYSSIFPSLMIKNQEVYVDKI